MTALLCPLLSVCNRIFLFVPPQETLMTDLSWWMRKRHPFCCMTSGNRWDLYIIHEMFLCLHWFISIISNNSIVMLNSVSVSFLKDNSQWLKEQCMRMGDAYIIVYSVTDKSSFEKASELRIQLRRARQSENIPIILVGNKSDLVRSREVSVDGKSMWSTNHLNLLVWCVQPICFQLRGSGFWSNFWLLLH